MDDKVNKMVVPDIKLVKMIIKGKGKYAGETCRIKIPPGLDILQIMNFRIIDDDREIVKMKGTVKGIGINNDSQQDDNGHPNQISIFFLNLFFRFLIYFRLILFQLFLC